MLSDLGFVFLWWLAISAIGWVFLPLAVKIFKGFFDSGYLFAKVLGILVSSFAVWLLASTRVLPFFTESIWLVLIGGLAINLWLAKKEGFIKTNRSRVWLWLGEEGLFFLTLAAWAWVRGFQPDIQGLEKFMDFGFVNSILKSQYFPPADMWFAGKSINYYYFGHFVTAFLTKLTGIDSAITYNLTIATLFAFTFSLTFSLTGNLIFTFTKQKIKERILVGGLLAAVLISLGANLHPAWYNFKMKILNRPYCDGSLSYWYPNATRYIGYCPDVDDKTIHEFPSYSFIVSDLHGHVSDIPFVLLFLALSFSLLTTLSQKKEFDRKDLYRYWPIPLSLAAMYITNQWDFPIYLLIFGLVLVLSFYRFFGFSLKTIAKTVTYLGISLVFAVLLVLPFQLNFEPMAKGVALVNARSLPHQLLILWGVPWAFGLTFMAFLVKKNFSSLKSFIKNIKKRGFDLPGLEGSGGDIFVLILLAVATILVIIPELIFLKDIYIASYHRANTMFKLTYQSFIMYSIAAGYIFSRVISGIRK